MASLICFCKSVTCKTLVLFSLRLPEDKKMKPWQNCKVLPNKRSPSCQHNAQLRDGAGLRTPVLQITSATSGKPPHWGQPVCKQLHLAPNTRTCTSLYMRPLHAWSCLHWPVPELNSSFLFSQICTRSVGLGHLLTAHLWKWPLLQEGVRAAQ